MFGLSILELLIVVIAIIVFIKPKDLPLLAYKIGKWYRKLRNVQLSFTREWQSFQQNIEDEMKEVKEIVKPLESVSFEQNSRKKTTLNQTNTKQNKKEGK